MFFTFPLNHFEPLCLVPPKGPYVDGRETNGVASVDVVAGSENEITCNAIEAKPAATLQWFKSKIIA